MGRIASACICACEGRNGAARMRTEDGQEADGLLWQLHPLIWQQILQP